MKNKTVKIRMEKEFFEKVLNKAKKEYKTFSEITRQMLLHYLRSK